MTAFDTKLAEWFEHNHWRVMSELSGEVTVSGVRIAYDRGAFEIAQPGAFVTPLGHRGRRGFILVQTAEDGTDAADSRAAFGEATLRRADATFGTISGLPEEQ